MKLVSRLLLLLCLTALCAAQTDWERIHEAGAKASKESRREPHRRRLPITNMVTESSANSRESPPA
jgi:hypothetical protein